MAFSFTIDREHGLVRFVAEGAFSSQDLMDSIKHVKADPAYLPGFDHLVDLRGVSAFQPGTEDIRKRSKHDWIDEGLDASRIAIVASSDIVFGMSRMYETLMSGASVSVRTFRDMAAAEAWLSRDSDAAETKS